MVKWASPVFDDPHRRNVALVWSSKEPTLTAGLRVEIQNDSDLMRTCTIPGTDEDIIISIIWRLLSANIFDRVICNRNKAVISRASTIKSLEGMMQAAAQTPAGKNTSLIYCFNRIRY